MWNIREYHYIHPSISQLIRNIKFPLISYFIPPYPSSSSAPSGNHPTCNKCLWSSCFRIKFSLITLVKDCSINKLTTIIHRYRIRGNRTCSTITNLNNLAVNIIIHLSCFIQSQRRKFIRSDNFPLSYLIALISFRHCSDGVNISLITFLPVCIRVFCSI